MSHSSRSCAGQSLDTLRPVGDPLRTRTCPGDAFLDLSRTVLVQPLYVGDRDASSVPVRATWTCRDCPSLWVCACVTLTVSPCATCVRGSCGVSSLWRGSPVWRGNTGKSFFHSDAKSLLEA